MKPFFHVIWNREPHVRESYHHTIREKLHKCIDGRQAVMID